MALTQVNAEGINVADDFAFTGTVTGATPITHVDQWRLTTNFTNNAIPIASNLERVDTAGQGLLGSAMAESSGIFTFPVTGIWFVSMQSEHYINGDDREINSIIQVTLDNSSYVQIARGATFINGTGANTHTSAACCSAVDVTNTSNVKVRFGVATNNSSTNTVSSSTQNLTFMTFIRLGDT